jgi:hypothetical protein
MFDERNAWDRNEVPIRERNPSPGVYHLRCKPQCRPPSRQRSSTSPSTTYATDRLRSSRAASSPSRGFIGHENTSSLGVASNSTRRNPTSSYGRRHFHILLALPLTTRAVSPFMTSRSSPPQMGVWVIGSAPFTTSHTGIWAALVRRIIESPSSHSTDCHPPSDHSILLLPPRRIWVLFAPFPSRISR